MKNYLFVLALLIFVTSCTGPASTVKEIDWLQGQWTRDFNDNTQLEKWELVNESLIGSSSFITTGDTTLMTNYKISSTGDGFSLSVQEIGFEIETIYESQTYSIDSIVFINSQANWPQTITYKLVQGNIQLTIDGNDRGMHKNVKFTYSK